MKKIIFALSAAVFLLMPTLSQAAPDARYMMRSRQAIQQDTRRVRGHAPGTLGHYLEARRAGYYPDSRAMEIAAGARRGTRPYNRYWSQEP